MTYTHKPTPLQNANPNTDRVICHNGNVIARTYRIDHGPALEAWAWYGQWIAIGNSGTGDSLGAVLAAIKSSYERCLAPTARN